MLTADEKVKELQEILDSKNLEMDEMRVHLDSVSGHVSSPQGDPKNKFDFADQRL